MTDQSIFEQPATTEATPPVDAPAQPQVTPEDQLLKSIVNEQGAPKYPSVAEALKALANAQEHIKRIEQENAQLREETLKARTVDTILEAIKPKESAPAAQEPPAADIDAVVNQVLQRRELEAKSAENLSVVISAASKAYGDKAGELFYSKAQELGFDNASINQLARSNPKAVLKLLGLEAQPITAPSVTTIRTDGFVPDQAAPSKSAMAYGSTADLVNQWRAAGEKVKKQLSI